MFNLFSRLGDPAIFQGNLGKRNYFEGWYFKHVGLKDARLAVIPGVSLTGEDSHAFIQVFNGRSGVSHYFRFPVEEFKPEKEPFGIRIGENHFSYDGLELDIEGEVKGSLRYTGVTPYRYSWRERGVMGWYGYVPFMETYHGLLSMDHRVSGSVKVGGDLLEFGDGDGYIEKDWGESFPSSWIWMQSNSFDEKASFMLSTAVIPWLGSSFIGHLAILYYEEEVVNMSTYRGGRITSLEKTENKVRLIVESRRHRLEVEAEQGESVHLRSPERGLMTGRTIESLSSRVKVTLRDNRGETMFSGIGHNAGLEIMDDRNELVKGLGLS